MAGGTEEREACVRTKATIRQGAHRVRVVACIEDPVDTKAGAGAGLSPSFNGER